mmetsp:Transcript_29568/g.41589  ORF Transcript_29568/g.41589 Transcript_29568/m.41589 type:complete len:389 (+) Transcript_29568:680-1846(+)
MSDPGVPKSAATKKKPKPKLEITSFVKDNNNGPSYAVSESGTFREGDIAIGKKGLLVKGESPQANSAEKFYQPINTPTHDLRPPSTGPITLELKDLDFSTELGSGSSGFVKKAIHRPSGSVVAVKVIQLEVEENIRKQIILELKTLHKTQCNHVVTFFDAFYNEGCIYIVLEFMDAGSLATVLEKAKKIPEKILAKIAFQVLGGLNYLHKKLHLIHRDIKPSNLLINKSGEVKISDFGVSGQLAHTLSKRQSWVGTVRYMSPERISGMSYSYDSDIWSLGLTLVECALGAFPYPGNPTNDNNNLQNNMSAPVGFWELLEFIVKQPPPVLDAKQFSPEMCDFIAKCLQKVPEERPTSTTLLNHPWIKQNNSSDINDSGTLREWLQQWNQ